MTQIMNDESTFSSSIRTKRNDKLPPFIKTVAAAIDLINDHWETVRGKRHWLETRDILYDAYDPPHDADRTKMAEIAFRDALQRERWLN
jgi:hypothetical protein